MRLFAIISAALAVLAMEFVALPAPAIAEEPIVLAQNERQPSLFRFLFGPRDPNARQRRDARPREQIRRTTPRRSTVRRTTPREPTVKVLTVDKAEDAKRVMVIGDFFARSLAKGLEAAFAENPNIAIVQAANGSSGLVRDDFYDWPAKLPELIAENNPDAIVVMLGGNDRQAIGKTGLRSDAWNAEYADRVAALANVIATSEKPGLWVGLVPVSSSTLSRDYSAFNSIYRETLENSPVKFIDVWNGFADDEGKYVSSGPDMNGQNRQLRVGDGLNFTSAGQRKLAFFVERDLQDVLKTGGAFLASLEPEAEGGPAAVPAISPMMSIDAVITGPASGLSTFSEKKPAEEKPASGPKITSAAAEAAGAAPPESQRTGGEPAAEAGTGKGQAGEEPEGDQPVVEALTQKAIAGAATPSGRIDDYTWPRPE
ncbi:SGNH family hydrolase [Afifella sp. IM 167]|uniref:SGNH/GDSL hydrolase family protein n=1 Tax=Afifella sp. IM 167 TaxID=2033586 RepID=UPI001CCC3E2D|nr:SGNH family hydrolase [Afifella sp. IM 167]